MQQDKNGYALRVMRTVWVFRTGYIGDSEGRTWPKEGIFDARFPTQEAAELYREFHPYVFKDPWGTWRTKEPYGLCAILSFEEEATDYIAIQGEHQ